MMFQYNENEIKLEFEQAEWVDLSEYAPSSIWDVIDAPASLVNKRSRIEFQVRIRRKTLFYTVVLIIPTVMMAFLSMADFFLPADSGKLMKSGKKEAQLPMGWIRKLIVYVKAKAMSLLLFTLEFF
ncbi:unnamed protein product [Angiostrongylus costaricensis]|uniref:Neur_chan_LBD domain-containing protein n=1 Tax=Angiostrongylus costaricensis TaxID=334426 RepID=A0A0R3PH53_ANGCS|nr:unnamed protein product [Angiostrongylus costaricensis]